MKNFFREFFMLHKHIVLMHLYIVHRYAFKIIILHLVRMSCVASAEPDFSMGKWTNRSTPLKRRLSIDINYYYQQKHGSILDIFKFKIIFISLKCTFFTKMHLSEKRPFHVFVLSVCPAG